MIWVDEPTCMGFMHAVRDACIRRGREQLDECGAHAGIHATAPGARRYRGHRGSCGAARLVQVSNAGVRQSGGPPNTPCLPSPPSPFPVFFLAPISEGVEELGVSVCAGHSSCLLCTALYICHTVCFLGHCSSKQELSKLRKLHRVGFWRMAKKCFKLKCNWCRRGTGQDCHQC